MFCWIGSRCRDLSGKGVAALTDYLVPLLIFGASAFALRKKENAYGLLIAGGAEGLQMLLSIIPSLVLLLTAVHML